MMQTFLLSFPLPRERQIGDWNDRVEKGMTAREGDSQASIPAWRMGMTKCERDYVIPE